MSAFTPGPWVFLDDETIRVREFAKNDLVGDHRGCIIADLSRSSGGRPHAHAEVVANARLIASAPDLYAALELTQQDYGHCEYRSGERSAERDSVIHDQLLCLLCRVDSALSKARGGK